MFLNLCIYEQPLVLFNNNNDVFIYIAQHYIHMFLCALTIFNLVLWTCSF